MAAAKPSPQHTARVAMGGAGIEYTFYLNLHRQHTLEQPVGGPPMDEIGGIERARRTIEAPANISAAEMSRFARPRRHRFLPLLIRDVLPCFAVRGKAGVAADSHL
ncbi:MAG: hypothetical protein WDZ50_05325 [Woeseia sp.]